MSSTTYPKVSFGDYVTNKSDSVPIGVLDNPVLCVELENIESNTGQILNPNLVSSVASVKNKFDIDSVLYGKLRPYLNKYWRAKCAGCCSTEIWVLRPLGPKLDIGYLYFLVQSPLFSRYSNTTSGSKMPRASWSIVAEMPFTLPSQQSQQKIVGLLSAIERLIHLQQRKLNALKVYKRGLLQQLVEAPAFDSTYPMMKLGEIFDERLERNCNNGELLSVTMGSGVVKRSDIEGKDNSSNDKSGYKCVFVNDIVYNSMRMWQGASGVSAYKGIVSPAYTVLKMSVNCDQNWFGLLFKTTRMINEFRKYSQGLTSDTWNLKYPQISQIHFRCPDVAQQQQASTVLVSIDRLVQMNESMCVQYSLYKQYLLGELFV